MQAGKMPRTLRSPERSIDTGMPITSIRAIPVERGPEGRVAGREAPEATGQSANALDVISNFRFPMAPSGKTNHRRINA
jgi:hypothetical protein